MTPNEDSPNDDFRVSDVEYDPETDAYYATFDPESVSVNGAVIDSIASVKQCDPLDLDPLYESVDTDSLDVLVQSASTKATPYLSISFRFEDADVTVRADGTVVLAPDESVE